MENRTGGTPPNQPSGSGGPGENSANSVSYSGANEFSSDNNVTAGTYSSSTGGENAVLVSSGDVSFSNANITKTGDSSGDEADFYGTNAAILVYNDGQLTIDGGAVMTDGAHANAVFAYGNGNITLNDVAISTSGDNSGGIMVTGGGTLTANNVAVTTTGNSSAPIRSDRGGGTISVNAGTFRSSGVGSPAIYSTANIIVKGAELISTSSEGVVIEGSNSVLLENTRVTDTNNTNNGHSETFKNIFIYQSQSGDAAEGTGEFTANNCLFTTNSGDHFFITNTTAEINLGGNKFVQNDENGGFLRAQAGYWGTSGKNGGIVKLNAFSQEMNGDITIDAISSLEFSLSHSYFKGAFLGEGNISVTLSSDSIIVLTGDSRISTLVNEDEENSNIYANGYKLYVDGEEVSINQDSAPESFLTFDESLLGEVSEVTEETTTVGTSDGSSSFPVWGYVAIGGGIIILIALIVALVAICLKNRKKKPLVLNDSLSQTDSSNNPPKPPVFN